MRDRGWRPIDEARDDIEQPDSGATKNGNLTFTTNPAPLSAPGTVSGAAAGCPNANWTGVNPQLTVTSIELSIAQGATRSTTAR